MFTGQDYWTKLVDWTDGLTQKIIASYLMRLTWLLGCMMHHITNSTAVLAQVDLFVMTIANALLRVHFKKL